MKSYVILTFVMFVYPTLCVLQESQVPSCIASSNTLKIEKWPNRLDTYGYSFFSIRVGGGDEVGVVAGRGMSHRCRMMAGTLKRPDSTAEPTDVST